MRPTRKPEMPPEIKAAYDEGSKLKADIKADWDERRDAEYEKWFNDPAVVELDEKAHSLLGKVAAWEAQFKKPAKKNHKHLDMTKDQIAGKPRPEGARPVKTFFSMSLDCRDAALIRDEAVFRGCTVEDVQRGIIKYMIDQIRRRS